MSTNKLFIPEKCRVGFQLRKGTFTGLLAYVIYYGPDGKIRKEPSWKSWCQLPGVLAEAEDYQVRRSFGLSHEDPLPTREEIAAEDARLEPREFDNAPVRGFVLNKGVRRFRWHFGSGRSMIRVYDPRGWELEITPDNLLNILMHTDCSRREIADEMVYAWTKGDLLLVPCSSGIYREAKAFTDLQHQKVGARDLEKGWSYTTKQREVLVYLGRHPWHEMKAPDQYTYSQMKRVRSVAHLFRDADGKVGPVRSVPTKIAAVDTPHAHDRYAEWLDAYLASPTASALVGWRRDPVEIESCETFASVGCARPGPGDSFYTGTLYIGGKKPEGCGAWRYRDLKLAVGENAFVPSRIVAADGSWERIENYSAGWPLNSAARRRVFAQQHDDVDVETLFMPIALFENGSEQQWEIGHHG